MIQKMPSMAGPMVNQITRRKILQSTASVGFTAAFGDLSVFQSLNEASAGETKIVPEDLKVDAEIEELVSFIWKTPRDQCVSLLVEHLKKGLSYRGFLASLFLVALQKSNSHHEVFEIHAAHQISLDAGVEERFLPLFWAMDSFKRQQEKFPAPVRSEINASFSSAQDAAKEFDSAMKQWDFERAEAALIILSKNEGQVQTMERLWHYAARDWGFIGHKAIAVANCWRVLNVVGWQYAEPVLRFVMYQFGFHFEKRPEKPGESQSYFPNMERVSKEIDSLPSDWKSSKGDVGATLELLNIMRAGNVNDACELAFKQLTDKSICAGSIWDAVHLAAGELMMRFGQEKRLVTRPLHSNTTANALHFSFRKCLSSRTQFLIILQAVGWITEFIRVENSRGLLRDIHIDDLESVSIPNSPFEASKEIFSILSKGSEFSLDDIADQSPAKRIQQDKAAQNVFSFAERFPASSVFHQMSRKLLIQKATFNAHNYKFPVAVFEDCNQVNVNWRPHILAVSAHWLFGSELPDAPMIQQARELLQLNKVY